MRSKKDYVVRPSERNKPVNSHFRDKGDIVKGERGIIVQLKGGTEKTIGSAHSSADGRDTSGGEDRIPH